MLRQLPLSSGAKTHLRGCLWLSKGREARIGSSMGSAVCWGWAGGPARASSVSTWMVKPRPAALDDEPNPPHPPASFPAAGLAFSS